MGHMPAYGPGDLGKQQHLYVWHYWGKYWTRRCCNKLSVYLPAYVQTNVHVQR